MAEEHFSAVDRLGKAGGPELGRVGNDIVAVRPVEIREGPVGHFVKTRLCEAMVAHDRGPDRLLVAYPGVQAERPRFASRDAERLVGFLKDRYGAPLSETRDKPVREGKVQREIYKVRWEQGRDRAVLTAQMDRRRASLSVSRGDFEEEIYRVR